MAQKLYTEEEIHRTFGLILNKTFYDGFIGAMKPIELPSDEEIKKEAQKQWGNVHRTGVLGFIECAKWLKEQILNQNK